MLIVILKNDDLVEASMGNIVRMAEKLSCVKGHYEKDDQMKVLQIMISKYPNILLIHLERACSGARHDI